MAKTGTGPDQARKAVKGRRLSQTDRTFPGQEYPHRKRKKSINDRITCSTQKRRCPLGTIPQGLAGKSPRAWLKIINIVRDCTIYKVTRIQRGGGNCGRSGPSRVRDTRWVYRSVKAPPAREFQQKKFFQGRKNVGLGGTSQRQGRKQPGTVGFSRKNDKTLLS